MITELNANTLKEVTGGVVVFRSVRLSSSSSNSEGSSSESALARFFARRDAARARNAEREAAQAATPSTGRRGFSPTATFGLP